MRVMKKLVNAARRALGTDSGSEIRKARIFQTPEGVWKFQSGAQTWGNYDTYERARKVAEEYNFIKTEK